jgi:hypothetical protein
MYTLKSAYVLHVEIEQRWKLLLIWMAAFHRLPSELLQAVHMELRGFMNPGPQLIVLTRFSGLTQRIYVKDRT